MRGPFYTVSDEYFHTTGTFKVKSRREYPCCYQGMMRDSVSWTEFIAAGCTIVFWTKCERSICNSLSLAPTITWPIGLWLLKRARHSSSQLARIFCPTAMVGQDEVIIKSRSVYHTSEDQAKINHFREHLALANATGALEFVVVL